MTSWVFSPSVLELAPVPERLLKQARKAVAFQRQALPFPVVVGYASDILGSRNWLPPEDTVNTATRYLIVADVPDAAMLRLVSLFDVRRPELRMHVTRDPIAVRRLLTARFRDAPWEGIVDAYALADDLVLLLGDFSIRSFRAHRIAGLQRPAKLEAFEIDEDGSFLYWPELDLHLGVPQLLQAFDPSYLADVEVERFRASAAIGAAIAALREERGLRQSDIANFSERQVRRVEQGISRLTGDAARKLASAFQMGLAEFLEYVARAAAQRHRSPFQDSA